MVGVSFFAARVGTGVHPATSTARCAPPIHTILHIRISKLTFDPHPHCVFLENVVYTQYAKHPPCFLGPMSTKKIVHEIAGSVYEMSVKEFSEKLRDLGYTFVLKDLVKKVVVDELHKANDDDKNKS